MDVRTAVLCVALALLPGAARAVSPLDAITTSPDVTTVIQGQTVDDEDVLDDDLQGGVALHAIPGLPAAADLVAYELLADGRELFSLDVTAVLPGPLTAEPRDVVGFDPSSQLYAVLFDGSAAGIPNGARIDALSVDGSRFFLSFDTTIAFPGFTADDEDVVVFDPASGSFVRVFDGSVAGIDRDLDLDALAALPNGHLLVSFDTSGEVGGVPFDDEDVLEWTAPSVWEVAYDGTLVDPGWKASDLDAVSALTSDGDGDGALDAQDNCPARPNPSQADRGGVGAGSPPDGIGDACQCGDVNGDGRVTAADATLVTRSLLVPPTATLARPELCDVGGAPSPATLGCTLSDAVVIRRALLGPPTATIEPACPAADGTP
jgi:hypothetical protein